MLAVFSWSADGLDAITWDPLEYLTSRLHRFERGDDGSRGGADSRATHFAAGERATGSRASWSYRIQICGGQSFRSARRLMKYPYRSFRL